MSPEPNTDTLANTVFLIGGGLALAVFTGWVMRDPVDWSTSSDGTPRRLIHEELTEEPKEEPSAEKA